MARANLVFFLSLKIWKKRPEKGRGVGGVWVGGWESINKINTSKTRMKCLFPWSFILQVVVLQLYEQHRHFGYSRYNKLLIVSEPGLQMGQYVRTESCSILFEWKPVLPWRDGLSVSRGTLLCVSNSSTLSLVRVVLNRSRSEEGFWDMDRRLSQSNDPVALFSFRCCAP